jgi:hypothetical protein
MPSRRYKRKIIKKRRKYNSRKRLRGSGSPLRKNTSLSPTRRSKSQKNPRTWTDFFNEVSLPFVPKKLEVPKAHQNRAEAAAVQANRRSVSPPKSRRRY